MEMDNDYYNLKVNQKEVEKLNEYVASIKKDPIKKKDYGFPNYMAKPYSKWSDKDKAEYERRWLEKVKRKNEINDKIEEVLKDENFFDDLLNNNN